MRTAPLASALLALAGALWGAASPLALARAQPLPSGLENQPAPGRPTPRPRPTAPTTPPQPTPTPPTPSAPAAAAQPDQLDRPEPAPPPRPDGSFRFTRTAEAVQLTTLTTAISQVLGLQIIASDAKASDASITLTTDLDIPRQDLLPFLETLLALNGLIMVEGPSPGVLLIVARTQGSYGESRFTTTRLIATPGLVPSTLSGPIGIVLREAAAPVAGGGLESRGGVQPNQAAASPAPPNVAFMDELGLLVITDAPARIAAVESLVAEIVARQAEVDWEYLPLSNIAASSARTGALELMGRQPQALGPAFGGQPGTPGAAAPFAQPTTRIASSNLADRLTVSRQGNALLFRGLPQETALLKRVLQILDRPNTLTPKWYDVGGFAEQIARQGERLGLGEVSSFVSAGGATATQAQGFQPPQQQSGPAFILDQRRGFIYYGTPEQQQRVAQMIQELGDLTTADTPVYEFYKLKNAAADDVAELVRSLITSDVPTSSGSGLLPGTTTQGNRRPDRGVRPTGGGLTFNPDGTTTQAGQGAPGAGAPGGGASTASDNAAIDPSADAFVLSDTANNQVVVRAPRRLQPQFARLIDRLDQRRPQVYIDAVIVTIDDDDNFLLAFETQFNRLGGTNSLTGRTLFGGAAGGVPTTPGTVGNIDPGGVFAILRADETPLVITAIASTNYARISASPKILVDDNAAAEFRFLAEEPTTTTNIADTTTTVTFDDFVEAGPSLVVIPRISAGDYLSLDYTFELSAFTEIATDPGIPPARSTTLITSESVTVPSESTIVVGGLTLDNSTDVVNKIPFLGDLPIVGQLFRGTSRANSRSTVYIFITPRILRSPIFEDAKLLTQGPRAAAQIPEQFSVGRPRRIELADIPPAQAPAPPPAPAAPPTPASPTPASRPAEPAVVIPDLSRTGRP
ncbi:MAG: hypothetical protein C0475_01150 [Planctomyces sp.]|nr:hypothetical protein [Planctomyces sp.]